jgi:hypothetical protein
MKSTLFILFVLIFFTAQSQSTITINGTGIPVTVNKPGKPGVYVNKFPPFIPPVGNVQVSPNDYEGTIDERIEAALVYIAANNGGTLELGLNEVTGTRIWNISQAIRPRNNTTIYLNSSRLKMANGVFDNMIRNYGIDVDESDPNGIADALNENQNIKIIGTGIATSFIEGATVPYTAPHPINGGAPVYWVGDWYGWRTITILFANVKGIEVSGISFSRVKGWTISNEHGCDSMWYHDLYFNTTVKNGDGINFRKGCSNFLVEDITGNTYDDIIACTALMFANNTYPNGDYVWPWQVGGWASNALGNNIENGVIRNVTGSSRTHMVILLSTGGTKVRNIDIDNITHVTYFTPISVLTVYTSASYGTPAEVGDIENITATNLLAANTDYCLEINAPTKDCSFDTIEQQAAGEVAYQLQPTYSAAQYQVNLTVTNVIGP